MINIDFKNGIVEDFTIVLADKSLSHKGQIVNVSDFVYKANLNSANEISFMVYEELDGNRERLWDDIIDLKLVWVKEVNEYFQIKVSLFDSKNVIMKITGTSLCEAELSQTYLYNIEINTEKDIERDNYVITKFYNPINTKGSLLHRILDKMPHYSINHVDESLFNIQRTFSINNKSIYDFLIGECSKQFNCLFQFDTTDRSISVYDLYTVCKSCGNRGEYNDVCPECKGTDLKYFGEDTLIYVDSENLTDEINYETNVDSIKNCFRLVAGDDDMTAAIINCNPNGSAYLYYFSNEQMADMPEELVSKLLSYDELYESYIPQYQSISEEIYDCIDKILYYRSSMMPDIETSEVTAATEAAKLTTQNLSPLGLSTLNAYTTVDTVNSALKNYAKVFVKTGYVKLEIASGKFVFNGTSSGLATGTWTGNFKVTSYEDKEDIAYSNTISITVTSDYEEFLHQKIMKNISSNDETIYDVLSITTLSLFKRALTYYSYNRLSSFADAIQGVLDILMEEQQSGVDSNYYNTFYKPYYDKLVVCQEEMNIRSSTIKTYENRYEELINSRQQIQNILNLQNYLGETLYNVFCSYRREDTYQNDNYISDGLDNVAIFKNAMEFIETAKKEIVKSGEYQHTITSNLDNLLVMDEFKTITDYFELGNWIRLRVDEDLYRLRLIGFEISFNSLQKINTTFSDVTKTINGMSDIQNIIQSAKSMATSYSYVQKQAEKGQGSSSIIKNWIEDGLNSSIITLKNNDQEEVTYDNHGILCRAYDDISDSYLDKQLKLTHNILAFTRDNWKTCSLALGEHNYYYYDNNKILKQAIGYGLTSDFITSGYVMGSQIIGGEIYSQNYSSTVGTYLNLNDGTFSFAGGKMKFDGNNLIFKGVDLTWGDITDAPTKVSDFTNDAGYQNSSQVTTITKNTITTSYIKAMNLTVGNEIQMGANATISWNNVTNQPTIPTNTNQLTNGAGYTTMTAVEGKGYITAPVATQITKDTVTTTYVNALNVKAGSVDAENISGTTISGKTISGGSISISNTNGIHTYSTSIINGILKCVYSNSSTGKNCTIELTTKGLEASDIECSYLSADSMAISSSGYLKCQGTLIASTASIDGDLTVSGTLYTASGTVSKSDRNAKNSIELLDLDLSSNFIYSLKPSRFKYNDGTSDRYHHGFIAQEIKESMGDEDWGLYVDENVEKLGNKGLRYEELIADLVATVQTLNKRLKILENKE